MAKRDIILRTEGLTKAFGGFVAVQDVTLEIERGSIHALIGPNGAGKTTCFNLLTSFLQPTSGRIVYEDRDITGWAPPALVNLGLARSFQISAVFPNISAVKNVGLALQRKRGESYDFWKSRSVLDCYDDEARTLLAEVGLEAAADLPAAQLPYGQKRALELATTLALNPKVMLLDEPMAGIGHDEIDRIADLILKAAVGRTVLMVEHNLSVVEKLSDRITVLARGRVLAEGDYETVSADPRVIEAYIGATDV